ncbi:MAG TPA: hypothetical protein VJ578_04725 [Dehalococcoidia bacterium]|nr:hypothetical protein [Dehalococcoidia bacterium]
MTWLLNALLIGRRVSPELKAVIRSMIEDLSAKAEKTASEADDAAVQLIKAGLTLLGIL